MAAQLQIHICSAQLGGDFFADLSLIARIGSGDGSAAPGAKERRGYAGARQPYNQHAFIFQLHSARHAYLNFNVVNANSANTSATIQNRTITFDSLQPSNSK